MSTATQSLSTLTNFSFAVYSDIHMVEDSYYGLLRSQWAAMLQNNCNRGDAFQVIVGDLGYGNSTDIQNVLSGLTVNPGALPIAKSCASRFPVFFGMGNHDLDGVGKRTWIDALMPGAVNPAHWGALTGSAPPSPPGDANHVYYSFDVGPNAHFIVLDGDYQAVQGPDTRSWQSMGPNQIAWFKQDVMSNAGKLVFVFIHEPIDEMPFGSTNTPYYVNNDLGLLLDYLSRYPSQGYVFSGHLHGLGGSTSWHNVTSVHVMNWGNNVYGVRVTVAGTKVTITQQAGAPVTNMDALPMYTAASTSGNTSVLPIAEENTPSGATRGTAVSSVASENGVTPTSGQYMLKFGSLNGYNQIFVSELAAKIVAGMRLKYDIYLYGTVGGDNIGLQPGWETTDGSLPTAVSDSNGVRLSDHPNTNAQHRYYEDLPSLKGCATNRWCSRDIDLTSLAGGWVMQWYLAGTTGSNATAVYLDHIRLTWPASNTPPSVSLTSPANNAAATQPATFTLNATATDSDGTVASVGFYAGPALLGTCTQAPYTWVWANVAAGTYSLTAVATDNLGATTTSAAVTVTVAPPPPANNPPSVSLTSPTNNATGTAPATFTVSATATDSDGSIASVSFYSGTTLLGTSTRAPYTMTWSNVAAGTYTVTARAMDNLGATTASQPVTVIVTALPAPWVNQDIGLVGVAGSAVYGSGVFTIKGSGSEISGSSDAFQFAYRPMNGDGTITACITTLQNANGSARAGVMIREALGAGAVNVAQVVTGLALQWRAAASGTTSAAAGIGSTPIWLKLVRSGSTFTGYVSNDGANWTATGATTVAMSSAVYVGLVVSSVDNTTLATAAFSNVTVQ